MNSSLSTVLCQGTEGFIVVAMIKFVKILMVLALGWCCQCATAMPSSLRTVSRRRTLIAPKRDFKRCIRKCRRSLPILLYFSHEQHALSERFPETISSPIPFPEDDQDPSQDPIEFDAFVCINLCLEIFGIRELPFLTKGSFCSCSAPPICKPILRKCFCPAYTCEKE